MTFDWSRYATGGAKRPDSFSGMKPQFNAALQQLFMSAPPEYGLQVGSGYRSIERQRELWNASDKSGRMVARPGGSQHNHGSAADLHAGGMRLDKASPEAKQWVHDNAAKYGLSFPMSWEPWHIELAGARGKNSLGSQVASQPASAPQDSGTPAPAMGAPINVGSAPATTGGIMGAFAPTPQEPAQQQPSFAQGMTDFKNGDYLQGVGNVFGSLGGGSQQQAPQAPPPVQLAPVQGPSSQQATALANYVQALLGKKVANG